MSAIDNLRMIARNSKDESMWSQIETWISIHVVEISNSYSVDIVHSVENINDRIKYHSECTLRDLAIDVIKRSAKEKEIPIRHDFKPTDLKNRTTEYVRKFERRVCIILDNQ